MTIIDTHMNCFEFSKILQRQIMLRKHLYIDRSPSPHSRLTQSWSMRLYWGVSGTEWGLRLSANPVDSEPVDEAAAGEHEPPEQTLIEAVAVSVTYFLSGCPSP